MQDAIRIDRAEQRVASAIDPGVQCIGLATIVFIHQPDIGVTCRGVNSADFLSWNPLAVGFRKLDQREFPDDQAQRRIRGAVVHDHHLELRVIKLQQRVNCRIDRTLLVEGRNQDADRRLIGGQVARQVLGAIVAHVTDDAEYGNVVQAQVGRIDAEEISKKRPLHIKEELRPECTHDAPPMASSAST